MTGPEVQAKRLSQPPRCPRYGGASGCDGADGRLGKGVRDLGRCHAPVVQPRPGHGHRAGPEVTPPPGRTDPRPWDGPRDAGDEPREARFRRRCDGHFRERDQEAEGIRKEGGPFDYVPRRQRPQIETRPESCRCDRGPRSVPRNAEGQAARLRRDRAPGAPPERLALPEVFLRQRAGDVGTAPDRGTGAHRILPRAVRDPVRRRDGFPGERKAPTESPVRHLPPKLVVGPPRGAVSVLEPRTKPFDQVPIPDVRGDGLVDPGRRHIEDALGPGRPGPASGFRDERDRVRLEVETILSLALVDLRRVAEEAAVMKDLVEVSDERTAIAEVQEFLLEFFHERLHLGDPLVSMTADAEQFASRRETEAFLDEEELVGSAGAALDELVHAVPGGVDQRRRRAVDQVARREEVPTGRRELLPIEDPEDRPEDVVALHVRRAVERIEDDRETSAAEVLHLSHFLRGDLGDE